MSANTHMMRSVSTFSTKPADINPSWHLVDATDETLGRLAARITIYLRGKHKPTYTPHMDTGDYIVVINADKLRITGDKQSNKVYYHHTGYPGGIKSTKYQEMMAKHPDRVLKLAVKRMLPKGPLGRTMFNKLKVYAGSEHPHIAQNPIPLEMQTGVGKSGHRLVIKQEDHADASK